MNQKELIIRKVKEEDIKSIVMLWDKLIKMKSIARKEMRYKKEAAELRKKFYLQCVHAEDNIMLVGTIENKIAAFLRGHIEENPYEWKKNHEKFGWIDTLVVHPSYQGKGIGKKMNQEIDNLFRKRKVRYIYVKIAEEDKKIYHAFGFQPFRIIVQKDLLVEIKR